MKTMAAIKISIYMDDYVLDVLKAFGELNEVVNKVLDACIDTVDLTELPSCPPLTKDTHRVDVIVTNQTYIDLSEMYGRNSKKFSLRRLLYWFVENSKYEEYEGFVPVQREDVRRTKYMIRACDFKKFVRLLRRYYCSDATCDNLEQALDAVIGELQ